MSHLWKIMKADYVDLPYIVNVADITVLYTMCSTPYNIIGIFHRRPKAATTNLDFNDY